MVKRKSRKAPIQKSSNNSKNPQGKHKPGNKGKQQSHATKVVSHIHANIPNKPASRDPYGASKANPSKVNNKRQRSHNESLGRPTWQPKSNASQGPPKIQTPTPDPFDVGFGARSAICMKVVSLNQFIMLIEDEHDACDSRMQVVDNAVPETQLHEDAMAT